MDLNCYGAFTVLISLKENLIKVLSKDLRAKKSRNIELYIKLAPFMRFNQNQWPILDYYIPLNLYI